MSSPVEPPHRPGLRKSARKSFESAQALWVATEHEPAERVAAEPTLLLLYRHSAAAALAALTPDGKLERWVDPSVFELEAPNPARGLVPHPLVVQLAGGRYEEPGPPLDAQRQADGLLALAERSQRALERARAFRLAVVGLGAVAVLAGVGVARFLVGRLTSGPDLAAGHPWKASSKFADCAPAQRSCGGAKTEIFFHTLEEESPWIWFDLEAPTSVSRLVIENRSDSALERAVPLVVELSDDAASWREVARRDKVFEVWKPAFTTQKARYVRLRVVRRSSLHLNAVQIY